MIQLDAPIAYVEPSISVEPSTLNPNIFNEAKELLQRGGWVQGHSHLGTKMCLGAALGMVYERHGMSRTAQSGYTYTLNKVISEQYPQLAGTGIVSFNDYGGTTFADVEKVLEKAAAQVA